MDIIEVRSKFVPVSHFSLPTANNITINLRTKLIGYRFNNGYLLGAPGPSIPSSSRRAGEVPLNRSLLRLNSSTSQEARTGISPADVYNSPPARFRALEYSKKRATAALAQSDDDFHPHICAMRRKISLVEIAAAVASSAICFITASICATTTGNR